MMDAAIDYAEAARNARDLAKLPPDELKARGAKGSRGRAKTGGKPAPLPSARQVLRRERHTLEGGEHGANVEEQLLPLGQG